MTLSLIGSETLLGRDIREVAEQEPLGGGLRLLGAVDQETRVLSVQRDEPVVMGSLDEEALRGSRVVLLAGSPAASRRAWELTSNLEQRPVLVDLTYTLEDQPQARLRAPLVEEQDAGDGSLLQVMAHPAAVAAALVLTRLHRLSPLRRSVLQVFEPASERGQEALEELQQQSVSLFSFQPLKKAHFDAQLAFNLLPRLGEDAPVQLEEVELRIERHLATLLSRHGSVPMPSLRLVQAPVFHGYSLSLWAEFAENPGVDAIVSAMAGPEIDLRTGDEEAPTNVGVAGQGGITVGAIEQDRNQSSAVWLWVVADNFRLMAENAWAVTRALL